MAIDARDDLIVVSEGLLGFDNLFDNNNFGNDIDAVEIVSIDIGGGPQAVGAGTVTSNFDLGVLSVGDAGDDELLGGNGRDKLYGNEGNDRINGGKGNDFITGDNGLDRLIGSGGDDVIHGGGDRDILNGGGGNDRMFGDDGNDVLFGAAGSDSLTGGSGRDVFLFNVGVSDEDRVEDFDPTQDFVRFVNGGPADFAALVPMLQQVGHDTVIDFGAGTELTLAFTNASSLNASDFHFFS